MELDSEEGEATLTLILLPEELQFAAVRFLGAVIRGARCANVYLSFSPHINGEGGCRCSMLIFHLDLDCSFAESRTARLH